MWHGVAAVESMLGGSSKTSTWNYCMTHSGSIYSEKLENTCPHTSLNTQVDSNIIHKSPKAQITLVSMNWQMGRCGIYRSSKLSFSDKKCTDIWYNLDELENMMEVTEASHIFHLFEVSRTSKFIETYSAVGRGWKEGRNGSDYSVGVYSPALIKTSWNQTVRMAAWYQVQRWSILFMATELHTLKW